MLRTLTIFGCFTFYSVLFFPYFCLVTCFQSVIVKSVERNAASMYRARQTLLGQECENCGVHLKNGNTGGVQLSTVGMTSLGKYSMYSHKVVIHVGHV